MDTKLTPNGPGGTIRKDKYIEPYLAEKRKEIMWSLKVQGHKNAEIGRIFRLTNARVGVIMEGMPSNYKSPWIKKDNY